MKILCVIPSRIGSTRLPLKPLLKIQGKPMIERVYENVAKCEFFNEVIVATDNHDIARVIENIDGKVVMTNKNIQTGSDRVAQVAKLYPEMDVIVNLQGDEPFITKNMLKALIAPYLAGELPDMTTLASPINHNLHYNDPNIVKVITDINQNAIYFSRSPIPYFKTENKVPVYHHMGLYAFQRDFLLKYTALTKTPLEKAESLEQLRALENGYKIRVCLTNEKSLEINTPEELELAQSFTVI